MSKRASSDPQVVQPSVARQLSWRDFDPAVLPGDPGSNLSVEFTTYRDRLDELLEHEGEFVVIRGDEILGYFRSRRAAISAAHKAYGPIPALLVKQVVEFEPIHWFGNAIL